MRRGGAVAVLAALMVVTMAAGAAAQLPPGGTFVDDDGSVHEGHIEAIAEEGVTRGCNPPENTRFCPTDPITRGEMAAFLTRALGLGPVEGDRFDDDDDSEFEGEIAALAEADITRGCDPPDNPRFCPDDHVTRGQMAAFLVRAFGYADDGGGDVFVDDDGSVFEGDIDRLATAGITVGCNPPDNTRFCPDELVQRDQMASFMGRALQLAPQTPPPTMVIAPYFFLDEDGRSGRTGPFLAPVHRRVAETSATAMASMEALVDGPSSEEAASIPAVSTSIPGGTVVNSVVVGDGVATVDLSAEFAAQQPTAAAAMRVAQVVFTLTRFESISSVRFLQEGLAVEVQTEDGGVVDRPVDRDDYLGYQAAVSVEQPLYGGMATDSLRVSGAVAVFGDAFHYALLGGDGDGHILAEGTATALAQGEWAPFDFTIDYDIDRSQRGSLVVWAEAIDGSQIDVREYPLLLQP